MSGSNPFADPFRDPSITQAASSGAAAAATNVIEDFNPFANTAPAAPTHQASGSAGVTRPSTANMSDELFRKQEELERKAEELRRREEDLERRAASGQPGGQPPRPHNWPPLPTFIPIEPCFYQDIEVEIPSQFQKTVTVVYHVFLSYVLALAVNVVAALVYMIFASGPLGLFLLAIIELALFSPCAFLFWFRPVYKAFRNDSSFNFMVFFLVLFLHSIFCFVQMLGLSSYAVGWINTFEMFSVSIPVALIMLISSVTFSLAFAGMVYSLLKVHHLYRGGGFSLDKARQEFTNGVMSDRNVQNAANAAASAAAGAAINNAARGGRF